MIQVHIRTNHGKFVWPVNPAYLDSIERIKERCRRSVLEGSVGPLADWTVGNHGQAGAPKQEPQRKSPQILECYVVGLPDLTRIPKPQLQDKSPTIEPEEASRWGRFTQTIHSIFHSKDPK